jgi:FSR family fosmidomycin resistance protein-like MFS transporter
MSLVGFTWSYLSLILVVGVGALGSAAFHPAGASIAAANGGTRRGAAVSIFSVGGNLGAALSPLWITAGIGWFGTRGTSVLIPVALLVSLLVYRQLGHVRRTATEPTRSSAIPLQEPSSIWIGLIVLSMLFRAWFQASFMTYLPTWLEANGRSSAVGGQMLFVFMACVGVGSLIGGALSDRVGRWQVLVLSLSLIGPAELVFLNAAELFQWVILGGIGMFIGATFPVGIVMAQEALPRGLGVASGIVIGLPWIGGGIGASVTGLIADHSSLRVGMESLILPAVLSAAGILAYAARVRPRNQV